MTNEWTTNERKKAIKWTYKRIKKGERMNYLTNRRKKNDLINE